MDDKKAFTELLQDMLEQAQINGNQISQEEIQEYFEDLNLSDEQMNHIYSYLVAHRITVKGFVPSASIRRESKLYEAAPEPDQNEMSEEAEDQKKRKQKSESESEGVKRAQKKVVAAEVSGAEDDEVEPDSAFLRMYLRDLRSTEKLTKTQEQELVQELVQLAGEGATNDSLKEKMIRFVNHKLRYVVNRARKYALGGETLDELIQEGNIGLMTAVQDLPQYSDAVSFLTYVEEQIVQTMERYINESYASGSEEKTLVAKVNFVSEAAKALKEENGQEPTLAEMAAYTNLTEEELLSIINLSADNLKA